jgi:hypothetical protein
MTMRIANMANGLAFPPYDDYAYFQSQYAHHAKKCGYFSHDSLSWRTLIHLIKGGKIELVDATVHNKKLTDALFFGAPTFCLAFNYALGQGHIRVCDFQTREMYRASHMSMHRPFIRKIRKLVRLFGNEKTKPLIIGDNVKLECHQNFKLDDKPLELREVIKGYG